MKPEKITNDELKRIRNYTLGIVGVLFAFPIMLNILFMIEAPYNIFQSVFKPSELLNYFGNFITAFATIAAVILTIRFTIEQSKTQGKLESERIVTGYRSERVAKEKDTKIAELTDLYDLLLCPEDYTSESFLSIATGYTIINYSNKLNQIYKKIQLEENLNIKNSVFFKIAKQLIELYHTEIVNYNNAHSEIDDDMDSVKQVIVNIKKEIEEYKITKRDLKVTVTTKMENKPMVNRTKADELNELLTDYQNRLKSLKTDLEKLSDSLEAKLEYIKSDYSVELKKNFDNVINEIEIEYEKCLKELYL